MTRIEIPLSKKKISLLLLGAIVFVVLGILFIIRPGSFVSTIFRNQEIIRISGIICVLFFGSAAIYGAKKLFDKSIGLTIDANGITDNTNASSVGLINWNDITEIKSKQIMSTKFLLIFINNPQKYLERVSIFKRKLMVANMKMCGTPLSITSNTLKYNFADLEKLILEELKQNKESILS